MNRINGVVLLFFGLTMETFGQAAEELHRYEYAHQSMGTLFRIVCYSESKSLSDRLSKQAFNRIDSLNYIMSDYLPDSELNRLCRESGSGQFVKVSSELFHITQLSCRWSNASDGIFDITIGPLSQLWRRAGRQEALPTPEQIQKAKESVGFQYIRLDEGRNAILLERPNMQLDLGGIAKGFAVDEIYRIFINSGLSHILVDGGGDIRVGNPPPGKKGWKIVLENVQESSKVLSISNTAVATSGDLYRYVEIESVRYSHIIDPRTGYGIKHPTSVTIQTATCTDADVLASILSIMDPKEGWQFLSKYPETKAVIMQEKDGKIKKYKKGKFKLSR